MNGFITSVRATAFVAVSTALLIAGCGGGGDNGGNNRSIPTAAKRIGPNTFQVNPGASWKPGPTDDFYNDSLASVELALLNNNQAVPAGAVLEVKSAGEFYFNVEGNLSAGATGLLVNALGQALTPGSGSTVDSSSASTNCSQSVASDTIPEDFSIPSDFIATLIVPEGATALRLSVSDCYYKDNSVYSADPIRVTITLK